MLEYPNGVIVRYFSAERPERLRGPEHELVWMDEIGAWPKLEESFSHIDMGLRLGQQPRALITTTPRSRPTLLDLVLGPKGLEGIRRGRTDVVVTRGISDENKDNLAPGSIEAMRSRYGASRFGRQELDAELLEKSGAELWREDQLRACRVPFIPVPLRRVVVAVDPTRSESPTDECGVIVAGLGEDGLAYVLEDCSLRASPHGWTEQAVAAYHKHRADALIYEKNRMGRTAELTMRTTDGRVKWKEVHASEGKKTRAEPVSALYEQGKVHHVGKFEVLEDEMCTWEPKAPSPNQMDALVWALTDLMLDERKPALILR
jgi:predicted phage terminase large subunit-like protein